MDEKKYMIRYKLPNRESKWWWHFYKIQNGIIHSYATPNANMIKKMTLKEAKKNILKIKKIRKKVDGKEPTKIQIINTETNGIVSFEDLEEEISRFELMEL